MKADNFNSEDRKSQRRKNFVNKNQEKFIHDDDDGIRKKLSKEFKKKRQELEEEDWENWDKYYNH